MDPKSVYETLAQYGVIGVMLFLVLYAYYRKDKLADELRAAHSKEKDDLNRAWQERLDEETSARIEDARQQRQLVADMAEKTFQAVHRCADVQDTLMQLMERDRSHAPHPPQLERAERTTEQPRPAKQTGPQRPVR